MNRKKRENEEEKGEGGVGEREGEIRAS